MKKFIVIALSGISLVSMAAVAQQKAQELNVYIINASTNSMQVQYQTCTYSLTDPVPRICQTPKNITIDGKSGNNTATIPVQYNNEVYPGLYVLSAKTAKGQKTFGYPSNCAALNITYGQNTLKLSDEDRKGSISCFVGESR